MSDVPHDRGGLPRARSAGERNGLLDVLPVLGARGHAERDHAICAALRELKRPGASILLVEQNFSVAKALGDTAAVMDDGRVVWTGEMAEFAASAELQERLMGLSMEAH